MSKRAIVNISNETETVEFISKLKEYGYEIVTVDLYSFKQNLLKTKTSMMEVIQNIDTNNLSMIREAVKQYKDLVIVDSNDYDNVIGELKINGEISERLKSYLAYKVFEYTAHYETLIANYLREQNELTDFPEIFTVTYEKSQNLRYGENPHQQAIYYKESIPKIGTLANAVQLHGKELSFNNINDTNIAVSLLKEFDKPTVVAVKHTNPCGVGTDSTICEAYIKAYNADSISIFDGIVAVNREIDKDTAVKMKETFTGLIIAPSCQNEALEILKQKQDIKLLLLKDISEKNSPNEIDMKKVSGGLLVQKVDNENYKEDEIQCVTDRKPTTEEMEQMKLAWIISKHTKCNAIILAKNNATVGVGPGQMNRITALNIAIERGKGKTEGSVMASDGFFFKDCIIAAKKAGITAIIQPGGPTKDQDLIDECNNAGIAMLLTGTRHFKH